MWLSRNRILDTRILHRLMEDSNRVSLVKTLLNESNGVLRDYHLGGAPAQDIVTAHAWFVDQVIKAIWEHQAPSAEKGAPSRSLPLAAMAGLSFIQDRTSIYWYSFKKDPLKHRDKTLNR